MTGEPNLAAIRAALLEHLPKDGSPRTVSDLSTLAFVPHDIVIDALLDDYMAGLVDFDLASDTYRRTDAKAAPRVSTSEDEQVAEVAIRVVAATRSAKSPEIALLALLSAFQGVASVHPSCAATFSRAAFDVSHRLAQEAEAFRAAHPTN